MFIEQYGPDEIGDCWECGEQADVEILFEKAPPIGRMTPIRILPAHISLCFACLGHISFESYHPLEPEEEREKR